MISTRRPTESPIRPANGRSSDRADRERADRDADRDAAVPERLLDVVGQHRREHRERGEVAEPARHDERERAA